MRNHRIDRIVYRRITRKSRYYRADREGGLYLHNRAEKQYALHARQRYVPKLIPPVFNAVQGARLIKLGVYILKARNVRQKRNTHTRPKLNNYKNREIIYLVFKPAYGLGYYS